MGNGLNPRYSSNAPSNSHPPVRRRVSKLIAIEVSAGESRDIASAYLETLSSKGLIVEEAIAVKTGEAIVLAGEGKVLPHVEKTVDHAVLLVSDPSLIPLRRELRIVVESSKPGEELGMVAGLVKEYSGRTGLRALGIIVCEEVADGLLNMVERLKDVEVVYATKKSLGV